MESNGTVVVTGASSGIGRASALVLARRGFAVFAGVRKQADAEAIRRDGGERIVPLLVDVTDATQVAHAAEEVSRAVGEHGLGGLVNNAGVGLVAPMECVSLDEVRRIFEVNLFGQLMLTQALLPSIRQARGRIVNVGSIGARIAMPFGGVLGATKSALASFNDALRIELRSSGIEVILIEPAAIDTPAVDKTLGAPDRMLAALPGDARARYQAPFRSFLERARAQEKHGSAPEVVAEVVARALTARTPRARYLVGKHARVLSWLPRLVPERMLDRVESRFFGL